MGDNPSPFIVREIPWNPYEYCRRMIVRDCQMVIFIDGTGRFEVPVSEVQYVLVGLGPVGVKSLHGPAGKMSLSETGKGIWIKIQESEYVTPTERMRKVISGEDYMYPYG